MQDPHWLEDPWHSSLCTESTKQCTANQKGAYKVHSIALEIFLEDKYWQFFLQPPISDYKTIVHWEN